MTEAQQPKKRRRGLRGAIALIVVVCLAVAAWQVAERIIDVDRYRPAVAALLEHSIGLPATIDALDLDLFPSPRVVAHGVVVGEGDFRASAPLVQAVIRPKALLNRQIDVATVTVSGLTVTAPKDPHRLVERLEGLEFSPPSAGANVGLTLSVGVVRARGAKLLLDGSQEPLLVFDAEARDLLSGSIPVRVSASPTALGEGARLECSLTVEPSAGPSVRGTVELQGVDVRALLDRPWIPAARADLTATVDGSNLERVAAEVTGAVEVADIAGLNGTFTADAWWDSGSVIVNNIAWESPGMTLKGDLTRQPDGLLACRIVEAEVRGDAVGLIATLLPGDAVGVAAQDGARIGLREALVGTTEGGQWRFASGGATFSGFDARLADGTPILEGIRGDAAVEEGVVRLGRFEAEGVSMSGILTPDLETGQVAVDLAGTAEIHTALVKLFVRSDALEALGGAVTFRQISGTFGKGAGIPADLQLDGTVEEGHAKVALPGVSEPVAVSQVTGNVTYEAGVIGLSDMHGDGFSIAQATVQPDWEQNEFAIELRGSAQLDHPQWAALIPKGVVSDLGGAVDVDRLAGTFVPGKGVPGDLVVEGTVKEAQASLTTSAFSDRLTSGSGRFAARPDAVEVACRAESVKLGALECEGTYTFASRVWHGWVSCDAARAGAALLTTAEHKRLAGPALDAFGASTFDVDLGFSTPPVERATIKAVRRGAPKLEVFAELLRRDGGWGVGAVEATGEVPLGVVDGVLPATLEAEGAATVGFRRAAEDPTFVVQADLGSCSMALGPYLRKRAGDPLSVQVDGRVTEAGWQPSAATIAYGGMTLPLFIEGDRLIADALDLDVRRLTGLLPDGAAAQGRLRGHVATNPTTLGLEFDQVAFALSPELAVDAITGDLAYADGQWTCRDLALRGANSEFHVTGALLDGQWRGRLTGKQVDLNALRAMTAAIPAAPTPEENVPAGFTRPEGLAGELDVDVGTLFFRRGRLDRVQAHVSADREAIRVRDLRCRPYTGAATGWVELTGLWPPPGGRMRLDLELDGVDARIIDEVVFTEPRDFHGTLSGRAQFDVPMGDAQQTLAGATGRAVFAAEKGTFGRLGFTTKLLTVLRATEVFRLRAPALKDEGLSYDTCHGVITMDKGFMTLEGVTLARPSYTMEAAGTIDFPHDASYVDVRVTFFEGMRGIMQHVPVIGEAASKLTGLMLTVRGSPYDPVVRGQRLQNAEEKGKQAEDATVGVIQDVLEGLLNR